jgi:hypothetical protein
MSTIVLESAKGVKGGKVQLTFSQLVNINTEKDSFNPLALLNASDERFNQQKPRYAWMSAMPQDIKTQFGIDVSNLKEGEELVIGLVDPRYASFPDAQLNIEIIEKVEGTDYQVANFEKSAKRAGTGGEFLLHNGMYIYVNPRIVPREPKHVILPIDKKDDKKVISNAIAEALGE